MENGNEKIEKKQEKTNQIFGSIIHSTIYANLVFSPRIPIFFSFSLSSLAFLSLNLSPALLAEKPSLTSFFLPFV